MDDKRISGFPELDAWAQAAYAQRDCELGYPGNQDILLRGFYEWYLANGLEVSCLNNAGDPFNEHPSVMSSQRFEREVLEFFAPLYGFTPGEFWGLVTNSGTDGNIHGIYFGASSLRCKTGREPIFYVSDEAHYSNMRLAHLQNFEVRLVKSDDMGRMIPEELERVLYPERPCLIVYAMGSTFKGAIDNQKALNAVLAKYPKMEVYRHVDAALFGGYLPFTEFKAMVNQREMGFQSISISGHKFFGTGDPAGIFLTTREVYDSQDHFNIAYINQDMKMISCSRSATVPLKYWWLIKHVGKEGWQQQAEALLANTAFLRQKFAEIGYPHWANELSNTVFFKRPAEEVVEKYHLAGSYDPRFGGELSHLVVMQHATRERIEAFVNDVKKYS